MSESSGCIGIIGSIPFQPIRDACHDAHWDKVRDRAQAEGDAPAAAGAGAGRLAVGPALIEVDEEGPG